jgi:hypothetical protein
MKAKSDGKLQSDESKSQAMDRLRSELEAYRRKHNTGSYTLGDYAPVTPKHPVHRAVVALERHYPGAMLPAKPHRHWMLLCKQSRAQDDAGARAGEALADLLEWVEQQCEPTIDTTGEEAGPMSKSEAARRLTGQDRWRKVESMFSGEQVRHLRGNQFMFRIDHLAENMRQQMRFSK